jgi:hypothetical protein
MEKIIKSRNFICIIIFSFFMCGCTAEAWSRAKDGWNRAQEEGRYARSPLHSSYTERLSAERFCENRFKQDGHAGDDRDFVAYKLDCLKSLGWI